METIPIVSHDTVRSLTVRNYEDNSTWLRAYDHDTKMIFSVALDEQERVTLIQALLAPPSQD